MINKKLVRVCKNNYYFLIDGVQVAKGPLSWVKVQLNKYGIRDIDFAVEQMVLNNHAVADFGIWGGFTVTQSWEEAHLGSYSDKLYKEAG